MALAGHAPPGPFVQLLSATTQAVLKLLRIDTTQARGMTEEEIAHSLEEGVDAGVIEQHEHQMVRNVFHLDDRPLTSMMVPRSDIEWLDAASAPWREALRAGRARAARTPGTRCAAARSTTWWAWSAWRACSRSGPTHEGTVEPHAAPARLRAGNAHRHGAAGAVPRAQSARHGVRGGRIRRGAGPDDAARPAGGDHRRTAARRAGARPGPRSATTAPGCSTA